MERIYANDPTEVRREQVLTHSFGRIPGQFETFDQVDAAIIGLQSLGLLTIVESTQINHAMADIKFPEVVGADFHDLSALILSPLTEGAAHLTSGSEARRKVAISVRAGLAFLPHIVELMGDDEIGFLTQTRDEETADPTSFDGKLGSFAGLHAVLVDPMLATGGSMLDMVDSVVKRGAETVTVVSAFTAPQGLLRVAMHPAVDQLITTPLEAGVDLRNFIVGAHKPHRAVGDFGDRFFGSEEDAVEAYIRKFVQLDFDQRFNAITTAAGLTRMDLPAPYFLKK